MAQKRALRSASRLNNVSITQPARKTTKDFSSTGEVLPGVQSLGVASAPAEDDRVQLSPTAPSKRRKLEPSEVGLRNLTSDTNSLDRPAGPYSTNAPLKTPRESRLVAYPQEVLDSSPSRTGVPRPTTSTNQLLEQACAHLIKADPRMQSLIDKHPCRLFSPEGLAEEVDPFQSLCNGIMAQQVSGAAAKSIKAKFIDLFRNHAEETGNKDELFFQTRKEESFFPSPTQVALSDLSYLRRAGLSARKAEYIRGLAEKFVTGELTAATLIRASDEEMIEKLTAVRDIFSTGDLGVQRGMAAFMGKNVQKLKANKGGKWKYMSESDMLSYSAKFAPYRYAS
ncbi:MAG: hypothetical protein LQ343_006940 [Gyalolechia ehrenbergii]|nr:MAG: hypothetical protein LQ343_006940 [Gyalolechia ehrenbergii]